MRLDLLRSLLVCLLLATWPLAVAAQTTAPATDQAAQTTEETVYRGELEALNQTFTDLQIGLVPVQRGAMTILLSSPSHRVTVYSNRLTVRTVGDAPAGTFDAWLTVELDGEGDLEARIEAMQRTLQDRVVASRQTVRVASRLRLIEAVDGFVLEIVKPYLHTVDFEIQSRLADQIVASCSGFAFLLGGIDCEALRAALGVAKVPMPEAGDRYWLAAKHLSESDRAFLATWAASAE